MTSRRGKQLAAALIVAPAAMWAGTTLAQTTPPPLLVGGAPAATPALKAKFVDDDNWGTGYVAEYQVTNVGTQAVAGWQLSFSLPAGSTLVSSWDGVASASGDEVSVTNASWDGRLSPGAVADFGFQVDYSTGSGRPQHCALDGGSCAGPAVALKKPVPTSVPGPGSGRAAHNDEPTTGVAGLGRFAPYVDMTLQPQDLVALSSASGTHDFHAGVCGLQWGLFPGMGWCDACRLALRLHQESNHRLPPGRSRGDHFVRR